METKLEFSGKRLLIVEDSYFLDDETRSLLSRMGIVVICFTAEDVLGGSDINLPVDGAVVDISLDADISFALTETLESLGIPHVFAFAGPASRGIHPQPYYLCADQTEIAFILTALFSKEQLH